jgi:hypothetical protein
VAGFGLSRLAKRENEEKKEPDYLADGSKHIITDRLIFLEFNSTGG